MQKLFSIFCLFFLLISCSKEKRSNKAGLKMQEFVEDISQTAREKNASFIIIPQNGIELAYKDLDYSEGLDPDYMQAINGIGLEGLFYSEDADTDGERLKMAQKLVGSKVVMVADFLKNNNNFSSAISKASENGFICFPRYSNNYNYDIIPDTILNENSDDISQLTDAKNYLYLISDDKFSSKTDYLNALRATNYDVLLIDLFYEGSALTKNEVNTLKTKANGGKRLVISYLDIGSAEKYRYYWKSDWKLHHPGWLKKEYDGYSDEIWVKFWKDDWQEIIYKGSDSYLNRVINAGFDGAYLDNVEAYYFLYYD